MRIVADTNTFLAVTMKEPERDDIIRLTSGHEVAAPEVLPFELGNALIAMLKKRRLRPADILSTWQAVCRIPVELIRIDIREALVLASEHGIYAYDAYFLVCAMQLGSPLITLDGGMKAVAKRVGIKVLE